MELRKVMFKKWIPKITVPSTLGYRTKEGTGCFEEEFCNNGLFHCWAAEFEESSEGFGNYTVALVEIYDGTIEKVLPENIKFIDTIKQF